MGQKGSPYERELCRKLSLWWTGGKRDDVFWRSSTSGAMATTRGKKGKKTEGHASDISSTHPSSAAFTDLLAIEAKRGYNNVHIGDMLEPKSFARTTFLGWAAQARASCDLAGTYSYIIIHRRDRKESIVYVPKPVWILIHSIHKADPAPYGEVYLEAGDFHVMPLDTFLSVIKPATIKELVKKV